MYAEQQSPETSSEVQETPITLSQPLTDVDADKDDEESDDESE